MCRVRHRGVGTEDKRTRSSTVDAVQGVMLESCLIGIVMDRNAVPSGQFSLISWLNTTD